MLVNESRFQQHPAVSLLSKYKYILLLNHAISSLLQREFDGSCTRLTPQSQYCVNTHRAKHWSHSKNYASLLDTSHCQFKGITGTMKCSAILQDPNQIQTLCFH